MESGDFATDCSPPSPTDLFPQSLKKYSIAGAEHDFSLVSGADDSYAGSNYISRGEGGSEDEENPSKNKKMKPHHRRHAPHQIKELEAFFKDFRNPDSNQRETLSKRIGLEPLQVKFWFQNKRTQIKTQMEREENLILRQENKQLQLENFTLMKAMKKVLCSNCSIPMVQGNVASTAEKQHLMTMNAWLKYELDRVRSISRRFQTTAMTPCDSPLMSCGATDIVAGSMISSPMSTVIGSADKPMLPQLALAAMEELVKMTEMAEPLWQRDMDFGWEKLNYEQYLKDFSPSIGDNPDEFVLEATRATGVAIINSLALVEVLMDGTEWTEMFPGVISSAATTEVVCNGVNGTRNGALQLMKAEFQVVSPLVPIRCVNFLRFCKQLADSTWAVVDVSVESVPDGGMQCRRRPSGCVVQDMPNGYSKVTWVEHTEYAEAVVHPLYRPLLRSGLGLGAPRWLAALQCRCECLAVIAASSFAIADPTAIIKVGGRRNMLKLATRMTGSFCAAVCTSSARGWKRLNTEGIREDVWLMTRQSVEDPGEPTGLVMSATTSVWIPATPRRVFDFLCDKNNRSEWDILSNGVSMQEKVHIAKGPDIGNAVSLMTSNGVKDGSPMLILQDTCELLILQDTCTDSTASMIVFSQVNVVEMQRMLGGARDSSQVAILPSGFAVVPDGQSTGGSLLTVGFQILVDRLPESKMMESVETVNGLVSCTLQKIQAGLGCCDEQQSLY